MDNNQFPPYNPNADYQRLRRFKVMFFVIVFVAVALIVFSTVNHYLHTGKLIVTVDPKDSVSVTKLNDTSTNTFSNTANGSISISLADGQYLVSVKGNSVASTQVANITGRNTTSLSIHPLVISSVEPVSSYNAQSVSASSSNLYYIDGPSGPLFNVNAQNAITQISPSGVDLNSAQWSNVAGTGVGQNQSGTLFSIVNNSVSLLPVPSIYPPGVLVSYSVAPNGNIFFSFGSNIYFDSHGIYKKIYQTTSTSPILVGYNNKLAIISPESDTNNSNNDNTNIALINTNGHVLATVDISATQAAWSPKGTYLAVAGSVDGILNGTTLKQVQSLPFNGGNVSNFTWLGDNSLLYGLQGGLWLDNVNSQKSQELASVSVFGYISKIYLNQGDSFVYVSVQNTNTSTPNSYQLVRFGLVKGYTPSSIMQQLQVFLPNTSGDCLIDYLYFTKPTILSGNTDSGNINCVAQATSYLQQYSVNTQALNFSTSSY